MTREPSQRGFFACFHCPFYSISFMRWLHSSAPRSMCTNWVVCASASVCMDMCLVRTTKRHDIETQFHKWMRCASDCVSVRVSAPRNAICISFCYVHSIHSNRSAPARSPCLANFPPPLPLRSPSSLIQYPLLRVRVGCKPSKLHHGCSCECQWIAINDSVIHAHIFHDTLPKGLLPVS